MHVLHIFNLLTEFKSIVNVNQPDHGFNSGEKSLCWGQTAFYGNLNKQELQYICLELLLLHLDTDSTV